MKLGDPENKNIIENYSKPIVAFVDSIRDFEHFPMEFLFFRGDQLQMALSQPVFNIFDT